MALTPAQLATLKTAINADPVLAAIPNTPDGAFTIADAFNAFASPDFWVYRTNVPITEIGDAINATELVGLTALNLQRLQAMTGDLSGGSINAAVDDRRAGFDQIFSGAGGNTTRPALAVVWRRRAKRVEKLFATGTGSTGQPAKMAFEGSISYQDVLDARALA